ncbi:MAG: tetratricopeptide repeat protein [Deltaproteobacteria bacterium]|jgi:tetratricopeptide (TPR) repeat protein|nr:tetratricopeptide repeat protein [Deltaproteobacteria bacterium]
MLKQEQVDALEILGYVHYRLGRFEEARIIFAGLLALDPASLTARKHLAAIFLASGKPQEALEYIEFFLKDRKLQKSELPALLMRAQALWLLGKKEESRAVMRAYASANQENS